MGFESRLWSPRRSGKRIESQKIKNRRARPVFCSFRSVPERYAVSGNRSFAGVVCLGRQPRSRQHPKLIFTIGPLLLQNRFTSPSLSGPEALSETLGKRAWTESGRASFCILTCLSAYFCLPENWFKAARGAFSKGCRNETDVQDGWTWLSREFFRGRSRWVLLVEKEGSPNYVRHVILTDH